MAAAEAFALKFANTEASEEMDSNNMILSKRRGESCACIVFRVIFLYLFFTPWPCDHQEESAVPPTASLPPAPAPTDAVCQRR